MSIVIPASLAATCSKTTERSTWLERVPAIVDEMQHRWSLELGAPFDGAEVSCAWVAPATRSDASPAVLKIGMPHMEGEHEIEALRIWDGDPTVLLLESDEDAGAMLLERCAPGTNLRAIPEPEQDVVIAQLLRRLWRAPPASHRLRPLAEMTAHWSRETRADRWRWPDAGLVEAGLALFEELPRTTDAHVMLATDLHAGNVLRAQREPWLVIDPKPFVGDPAYDATQHLLFNCRERLRADPDATIGRIADLCGLDAARVRRWIFARAAAESRDEWNDEQMTLARRLAP